MIIFGTTVTRKLLEKGMFSCPQCSGDTPFEKRRAKEWFHLYWIPLIPMEEHPPYVECKQCRNTFIERVLEHNASSDVIQAEWSRAMLLIMAKMALADGHVDQSELETMQKVYASIAQSEIEMDFITHAVQEAKGEAISVLEIAARCSTTLNDHGREMVLSAAVLVALADGDFAEEEQVLVHQIGEALGLSRAHLRGIVSQLLDDAQNAPNHTHNH